MRHLRAPVMLILGLALVAVLAASATAKTTKFTATYAGTVTEKVAGQTVTATTKGTGKGTLIGRSTVSGIVTATTSDQACAPFGGPGSIVGTGGKMKVTVVNARGCAASQEAQDDISVAGFVTVKGGTGKWKAAKASLHFTGHYNRSSGAFTVKLTGTLKY
jgi:hypothetical protein